MQDFCKSYGYSDRLHNVIKRAYCKGDRFIFPLEITQPQLKKTATTVA
ncbi:MAG: hypothetical protein RM021_007015 [Nostoc sp. EkiNYC01]|nr:hypothetical protein [Nostoc sp. EkiNYC01]